MPELFPILVIILVSVLVSNIKKKNAKQTQQPKRPTVRVSQPETEKVENQIFEKPAYDFSEEESFCQASGEDEQREWQSMETTEGEEFDGHDHGSQMTFGELESDEPIITEDAKDILKGIVWSEILTRKKR